METKDILKKVRKIEIKTRGLSHQIFSGHYHSAFKGRGMAFSEVREYQYGDDIRNIDWNVTARFNHPFIKVFEEEREMTVMLLIDVSGSNDFGSRKNFKSNVITEVSAILAFSAIQNNDKVGVIFFSSKVERFIAPAKGRTHILRIIREMINFKAEERGTNIEEALRYLTNAVKKKCTAFILSDFMDLNYAKALKIASRKHDLGAIRIFDERETELPNLGLIKLVDAETGREHWVDTAKSRIRENYRQHYLNQTQTTQKLFRSAGVDSVDINTQDDYVKPLIKLFKMRESRF
ncbi:MAG: DUF58 domain-containing protein [Bacteroidales bacterium]|nr:DUF58 domain-containing protein [Bacteroidales bacterium]